MMNPIDLTVIIIYLIFLLFVGFWVRKKASTSIDSYFLGDRKLPWWLLGISGMGLNLDMTGTMLIVSLLSVFGIKSLYIFLRGDIVLILAFLLIFAGKWMQRARVMTTAEWMKFRFGDGRQGKVARILQAISSLIFIIFLLGYSAEGTGKFLNIFFPSIPPQICALALFLIALSFTATSGLLGVVYTDIIQAALICFGTIYFSILAFVKVNPERLAEITPSGFADIIPPINMTNLPAGLELYSSFGLVAFFYFFMIVIGGIGCAGGASDMNQRYYAAKSPREASLLTLFWMFLFTFRWPMVIGIAVLGLSLGIPMHDQSQAELVLPRVFAEYLPYGIQGLLISALLAAGISTLDAVFNAGTAYFVRDLYQAFIKTKASSRHYVIVSKIATISLVAVALIIAQLADTINAIWSWLMTAYGPGMMVPFVLRWFWWRFNGYGFAIGSAFGMIAAMVIPFVATELPEYYMIPINMFISLIGCLIGTYAFGHTPQSLLKEFYQKTRSGGAWAPIRKLLDGAEIKSIDKENRRDFFSVLVAIPWQFILFLMPMLIVIHQWTKFFTVAIIWTALSVFLYNFWYKKLPDEAE